MATFEINAEDVINALSDPCPNTLDYDYRLSKPKSPPCLNWKRCGECVDGRVLNNYGRQLFEMAALKAQRGE